MIKNKDFIVYIGLGSNKNNPKKNINNALKELSKKIEIIKQSSLYQTEPIGKNSTKNFFNMVIKAKTNLSPYSLLELLHQI